MRIETRYYRWIIAAVGMMSVFASLGFGRFALGMLLPAMSASLKLSYSQMGFVSTANFIGYLAAVLGCAVLVKRIGSRRLISLALFFISVCLVAVSRMHGFVWTAFFFFLVGLGGGASNVPTMALASVWFPEKMRGKGAGIIVTGSGFAIILSGKLIPFLNSVQPHEGWRLSWLVFAVIVAVVALVCYLVIRDSPEELHNEPEAVEHPPVHPNRSGTTKSVYRSAVVYHLGVLYFLFGFTYVIFATFFVTTLVKERNYTEAVAGVYWFWVGILSILSGPVWGFLADRLGRKVALTGVFMFQGIAYLLMAWNGAEIFLPLTVVFYGVTAWSIPAIIAAVMGDYVDVSKIAQAFGFVTFILGLGQIAGPSVAGLMAERTNSFTASFYLIAFSAALAGVLAMLLKKPTRH